MPRILEFIVEENESGYTVGELLRRRTVSKRLIVKLKRFENGITLNGNRIRTIDEVSIGDILSVTLEDSKKLEPNYKLTVPIVYEDDDIIVYDKPVGMPVHPSLKHQGDTLGNCFAANYPELTFRPVNRLDRDTSGLCAVAKNAHAANFLQGRLDKTYFAVVCGKIETGGRIDAPIGRVNESIIKREVREDGKPSVTDYIVSVSNDKYTLVKVKLLTGRTHQIRVHFAHIGYPLAGDDLYGGDTSDISCQALHCGELAFHNNITGKDILLFSQIRDEMKKLIV